MKKIVLSIGLMLMVCGIAVNAQNFSIVKTDAADYPKIVVKIEVPEGSEATQADFRILEEGREVPFNFSKSDSGDQEGNKAVCFLIEASGHTYGKPLENFKNAVAAAMRGLGPDDVVNVCYFGKANSDGRALNTLSAEFTTDKDLLASELKSKITAQRDTNYTADVFKGIYECLDFMNNKSGLPANRVLIVISAAINNSRSPIKAEDCIERANQFLIPVYTLTYKTNNRYAADNFVRISDKTNGESKSVKTQDDITTAISDFYGMIENNSVVPLSFFTLDFVTSQSGDSNAFQVKYLESTQNGSFIIPADKVSFWKKYMLIIIICIALVIIGVGIAFFFILKGKKKKDTKQDDRLKAMEERNQALQQQLNMSKEPPKTQVQQPQKFDLKKTQIGGGGGTPMLMVSAGKFAKNFPLNKPQMTIGRSEGNDIVIPETTVSGSHATIINENGNWILIDNNSTNGTFVNGTKISKQRIAPTDTIKLGAAFIKLQF